MVNRTSPKAFYPMFRAPPVWSFSERRTNFEDSSPLCLFFYEGPQLLVAPFMGRWAFWVALPCELGEDVQDFRFWLVSTPEGPMTQALTDLSRDHLRAVIDRGKSYLVKTELELESFLLSGWEVTHRIPDKYHVGEGLRGPEFEVTEDRQKRLLELPMEVEAINAVRDFAERREANRKALLASIQVA